MVVEIEGTQHRLTGTADAQYDEWKNLLLELYSAETGYIPEIDVYTEELPEREEVAEAEAQELEVYTIEPEDLEVEDDAAQQPAAETIAGAR
jgi:cellulose biosynthesis protein BcsQ